MEYEYMVFYHDILNSDQAIKFLTVNIIFWEFIQNPLSQF